MRFLRVCLPILWIVGSVSESLQSIRRPPLKSVIGKESPAE